MDTVHYQIFHEAGAPLELKSSPCPELGSGDVLVAITLATICGSDIHTYLGHRNEPTPCILGHEGMGTVIASARDAVSVGERVTWSLADSCGNCSPCADHAIPEKCDDLFKYGHASLSNGTGLNGTYATHILLRPGTAIIPLPDSVSDALAAPANCALATMVKAVEQLPATTKSVVVQGMGMLGLYTCALLHARGIRTYGVDVNETRLEFAAKFGAKPIHGNNDCVATILNANCGKVDGVIEAAGFAPVVKDGMAMLRYGGTYVLVGLVHPDSKLPITGEDIIRKNATICGIHNYAPQHLQQGIDFLATNATTYPFDDLVSPPYPLTDLETAFELAQQHTWCRVAITPSN